MEVGLALAEIRDLRLYRREYSGFEEYCRKKWGWSKQHAYRLIEAAPVAKSNLQVTSQNAAIELARIEPSQRGGVVQAIVDQGKPVTAAEVKRHLPAPPMQPGQAGRTSGTGGRDEAQGKLMARPVLRPSEGETAGDQHDTDMSSRDKGKEGEREFAEFMRVHGFEARRGSSSRVGRRAPMWCARRCRGCTWR